MTTSVKDLMAAANAAVPRLRPDEVRKMMGAADVLIVDVRDSPEIQASGKIKGAVAVSRGMLEFRADPDVPSHNPAFTKDKRVVLYCASGGRSRRSQARPFGRWATSRCSMRAGSRKWRMPD